MLLLSHDKLEERRRSATGPLAPLAESLAADLAPLIGREIYLPPEKALLSRAGGRCERDGTTLEFDPFSPHQHRCPRCGEVYGGDLHHRAWVYPYQLWLAERAAHSALLCALRGEKAFGTLAHDILRRYADTYLSYPNRDNVLGPTRLFFSTYLESIWLLQICVAADLMESSGDRKIADEVRECIVRPSAALIAGYDEGFSNRQVWNNAALMAAALLLNDRSSAEHIVNAPSGVAAHIANGLLSDGSWYEGENYHLFAHRGLWYGVTMAEAAGIPIAVPLLERFQEGFATPFATALPDFTLPSRKDSQYAISLRQSRFAELCELGLARSDDPRLAGALAQLYADDVPRGDTGRARSTADVERNMPASRLSRADLGWRSLLHARAELPPLQHAAPRSAHLDGQGVTVFRRDAGQVYVALDWGQPGGGHGHPDRLNVLFSEGTTRWLDDMGTGSYVDSSLHWYRSTLAHNAPLFDGHSQQRVPGELLAHDERGGVGWAFAHVGEIAPGVSAQRALIVTPDYFVDELTWVADQPVRFELPVHFDGEAEDLTFEAGVLDGGGGLEDGFDFVRDARVASRAAMNPVMLTSRRDGHHARGWICTAEDAEWFCVVAPGQPADAARPFHVVRCEGTGGVVRSVWAWSERVESVSFAGESVAVQLGNEQHVHYRTNEYWQMEMKVGGAQSGIELYGWRKPERESEPELISVQEPAVPPVAIRRGAPPIVWELGEAHYRRSEENWAEAGRPTARVSLSATAHELVVGVRVVTSAPVFVAAGAINPYDNEHADINGHGVQLYLRTPDDGGAWIVVPEVGRSKARARPLPGWGAFELADTEWAPTADGFEISMRVALPSDVRSDSLPIGIDVLVNETTPGRERRRGQLVLSGAEGEFVYLRGDRHDPGRLVRIIVLP